MGIKPRRGSWRYLAEDFKNMIYEPFKFIVLLGAEGVMISAVLMFISGIMLKIGLKFVKDDNEYDEYKKEKWNRRMNYVLKYNVIFFLNGLLISIIFKDSKEYNAIIFFGIAGLSIIEYIVINRYLRKRRNKNGNNI
ncbi:MAG: hypothetical protein HFJ26_06675 [Clostridia bacterium]|jgi:L-asparagine transporter-like permease|nr:hypothetical protein [Clostridia bacterium]